MVNKDVIETVKAFIEQNGEGVFSSKQIFEFDAKKSKQEGGKSPFYAAINNDKYGNKVERGRWRIDQDFLDLLEGKTPQASTNRTSELKKPVEKTEKKEAIIISETATYTFISHSSKDKDLANRICTSLESKGVKCWISYKNIKPSEVYTEKIVQAINGSSSVIVLISSHACESDEVATELILAKNKKKPIFPVRIEEIEPYGKIEYITSTRQRVDVFNDFDLGISQLENELKNIP